MKRSKISFNNSEYIVNFIDKPHEAVIIAQKLKDSDTKNFGLDIETYRKVEHPRGGLDPHLSGVSTVQLYDGHHTCYVFDAKICGLEWFKLLKDKNFVAHYGIFEIKHLTHNSIPNLNIGCSMLLSILVDRAERSPFVDDDDEEIEDEEEPSTWKGYGLDSIIGRLYDLRIDKGWQKYDWSIRPLPFEPITYAALDAILTYKIAETQIVKVNTYKMQKHYKLLKEMQHVISDMELAGIYIDKERHEKLIHEWTDLLLKQKLKCAKYFGEINLNSTKQLGQWAEKTHKAEELDKWIKTKTGKIGFGKSALATMQHLPEIKALLDYKKTSKLLSTYGETLEQQVNPVTKRIHCSFSLGETRTGRLSSREPNLQNLPRESSMRDIFIAEEGNKLIVADFNQIELRVAGEVSRDPVILKAYRDGLDLHSIFASRMYGIPISKVTKDQRQIAKSANFGAIYGMGPNKFITYTLSSTNGKVQLDFEKAKHVIDSLWDLYKVYGAWCRKVRNEAEIAGFVRTPMGKMRKLHPKEVYTKAPNTIVQGGAFEVMAIAMVNLREKLKTINTGSSLDARLINSVHDEIIVEVNDQEVYNVKKWVEEAMCYGMKQVFPKATLNGLANGIICGSWGEGKA